MRLISFVRYHLFSFLWAGFILIMTMIPGHSLPEFSWNYLLSADALAHFSLYGGFVLLLAIGAAKQYKYAWQRYYPGLFAVTLAILYGLLMETLQDQFLRDRYFEIADILANITGSFAGVLIFRLLYFRI